MDVRGATQRRQGRTGVNGMKNNGRRSRIEGFHRMQRSERLARLAACAGLEEGEIATLLDPNPLPFPAADHMIENVIGVVALPLGVGLNFLINGHEYLVPMAVEEASIVAAASHAARLIRDSGGFVADADPPVMIGQILLVKVPDIDAAARRIEAAEPRLLAAANAVHPNMAKRGGGARAIQVRPLPATTSGPMLVVHLLIEVGDAMGANAVNSIAEALAPSVEELSGGEARLRILSNLADERLARATAHVDFKLLDSGALSGREVAERIVEASAFAAADPYRAATHNKGIMNGIDAVAIATGNDWRGIEAGAHAFAARNGRYSSLTEWRIDQDRLVGKIELPLAVGIVGGNSECNPRIRLSLRMLGVRSARELAGVMAAVGLGQNLAAVRALVTDGIQRGHMALHARGLAVAAGAPEPLVDDVVRQLLASGEIKLSKAREIVQSTQLGA
jgi:hydroxymethylglutaryl-CoA reductase